MVFSRFFVFRCVHNSIIVMTCQCLFKKNKGLLSVLFIQLIISLFFYLFSCNHFSINCRISSLEFIALCLQVAWKLSFICLSSLICNTTRLLFSSTYAICITYLIYIITDVMTSCNISHIRKKIIIKNFFKKCLTSHDMYCIIMSTKVMTTHDISTLKISYRALSSLVYTLCIIIDYHGTA